jgi:hypothetical protein
VGVSKRNTDGTGVARISPPLFAVVPLTTPIQLIDSVQVSAPFPACDPRDRVPHDETWTTARALRTVPSGFAVRAAPVGGAHVSDTAMYITLLVVAVALTFLVGRLLVTAGEPFLQEVFEDTKVTRSVNMLLSVLFHLITLGVLAIITVIDFASDMEPLQQFVVKLGVVLLILGIAYGISMLVLIRVRERRRATQISEQVQERLAERGSPAVVRPIVDPTTQPAPKQL